MKKLYLCPSYVPIGRLTSRHFPQACALCFKISLVVYTFIIGEWAGIILDTPVGKNDGTVAGIRYFQCQPNYGVFVKVEKLQKIADETDNKPQTGVSTTVDRFKAVDRTSTPVRAPDSTEIPKDLSVGDQVSIGDTRTGMLRYLGETGFAKGIWCGVELQEPVGKNDGAVAGTRYVNSTWS